MGFQQHPAFHFAHCSLKADKRQLCIIIWDELRCLDIVCRFTFFSRVFLNRRQSSEIFFIIFCTGFAAMGMHASTENMQKLFRFSGKVCFVPQETAAILQATSLRCKAGTEVKVLKWFTRQWNSYLFTDYGSHMVGQMETNDWFHFKWQRL